MLLIKEIELDIYQNEVDLICKILDILRIKRSDLISYEIYKKSLDARKSPVYKYQVLVELKNESKYKNNKNIVKYIKNDFSIEKVQTKQKPIIIGYGPAGMFCAYRLLQAGLKPIVIEKGKRIIERQKDVKEFFEKGILNPSSNVQFGEGGAGTFSDAKLTTRIKDPFVEYILDTFIKFGANENIKYLNHAHIGTDEIRKIITNFTNYLINEGVEFHFDEEFQKLELNNQKVEAVITNKETYKTSICIIALGHSAYSTIKNLYEQNVSIISKDIAIGFRVEHPQSLIDENQYNNSVIKEPSEYFLRYKDVKGVYSFCMCPGGMVIPASSDENRIVTNGMSYSKRDSKIANSAILIQVNKEEFNSHPLGGFDYLREYEQKAYLISNSYKAPACNIKDYINNKTNPLIMESTYPLGVYQYDFNNFFKQSDNEIFKKALIHFDTKIKGFIDKGIMVGPETRSSCPIRILRDDKHQSVNTQGLFPIGEGAGYGGGIMSCALDGIKTANIIVQNINEFSH